MPILRRDLLRYAVAFASTPCLSTALTGCALGRPEQAGLSDALFTHGVASGDPQADAIMLWTRALPDTPGRPRIGWELAVDAEFSQVVRSGSIETGSERDYTVKVDVRDLTPGSTYFYRFLSGTGSSTVGRTRTLPVGAVEELRLAVFSCSNYPAGYFHAYTEAARLDGIDAFLHLGDYLYEYGVGGYATERAAELGRDLPAGNAGELVSLEDYRRRYALYRSDAALQTLHSRAPMIAVWDDHEVANDTWQSGAENHSADEGRFSDRRAAAVRAYFEWMPLRPVVPDDEGRVYRSFSFGDLVDLHMLDTRLIGRDKQLSYTNYIDSETGAMDTSEFARDISDPQRSLLGEAQRAWLYGSLEASAAHWQVLGQQVLMARMTMPATLLTTLFRERDYAITAALIEELAQDKAALAAGETLAPGRASRLQQQLPYNLDAWDGYPAEREQLYAVAQRLNKALVVLAGDTHNAWYSELRDRSGRPVGVELATPGVTSPGMERYLSLDELQAQNLGSALPALIDELQFCDLYRRGFMEVVFTPTQVNTIWHFLDSVEEEAYVVWREERRARI